MHPEDPQQWWKEIDQQQAELWNFRNLLWQRTYILIIITGARQRKQVKIIFFLTCGRVIRGIFRKSKIS